MEADHRNRMISAFQNKDVCTTGAVAAQIQTMIKKYFTEHEVSTSCATYINLKGHNKNKNT